MKFQTIYQLILINSYFYLFEIFRFFNIFKLLILCFSVLDILFNLLLKPSLFILTFAASSFVKASIFRTGTFSFMKAILFKINTFFRRFYRI